MKRIWLLLLGLLTLGAGALCVAEPPRPPARPNVLMIAVDDLNHWVGYLERNRQTITPNIDRLAARGLRFSRSYCAAPVCNPSRTALLTGLRPATTGVYDNHDDWRAVVRPELTLLTTFRQAGYYVAGAGKIYHGGFDRRSEWDDYLKLSQTRRAGPDSHGRSGRRRHQVRAARLRRRRYARSSHRRLWHQAIETPAREALLLDHRAA
jgi:arylsulfatase A-like enzyme